MTKANSGPKHGRGTNSVRNLLAQGRRADPFPLGPQDVSALGMQRADLRYQYGITRASLSAQAALARQMFKRDRFSAREQARAGISAAAGSAADQGFTGGTGVRIAREQGAIGAAEGAIQDARAARNAELMGIAQSRLQAIAQLRMGLTSLAMQRAASQRHMALGAYGSGGQNPWGY